MDIATLIAQIATWLTLVVIFFTLMEMRNQRKASQKPDLIIPKSSVYGYSAYAYGSTDTNWTPLLIPRFWSKNYLQEMPPTFPHSGREIKAYNVGFGVAKNIAFKWTIEYDKTVQEIKDYCYQNSVPIVVQLVENKLRIIEARNEEDYPLSSEEAYEFLMPASITSEGLLSEIPMAFAELVAISICLKIHHSRLVQNTPSELEIAIPSMTLELQYDDLENSHYFKKFDVQFSMGYFSPYQNDRDGLGKTIFYGSIEFKTKTER